MYKGIAKFNVPFGILGKCLDYLNSEFGHFKVEKLNGKFEFEVECETLNQRDALESMNWEDMSYEVYPGVMLFLT